MALKYYYEYTSSNNSNKQSTLVKFKKHASSIDGYFKNVNVDTERDDIISQLTAIVSTCNHVDKCEREIASTGRRRTCEELSHTVQ